MDSRRHGSQHALCIDVASLNYALPNNLSGVCTIYFHPSIDIIYSSRLLRLLFWFKNASLKGINLTHQLWKHLQPMLFTRQENIEQHFCQLHFELLNIKLSNSALARDININDGQHLSIRFGALLQVLLLAHLYRPVLTHKLRARLPPSYLETS